MSNNNQNSVQGNFTDEQKRYAEYNDKRTEVGSALKTLRGSSISRSSKGVGKLIGGEYYVHKDYTDAIVPEVEMSEARVTFDDPEGVMTNPEIEVFPANGGNS